MKRSRRGAWIGLGMTAAVLGAVPQPGVAVYRETRALWVQRASLTTPGSIQQVVDAARAAGFTTLLVQVRGRGDALFSGSREPRSSLLDATDAEFDPLATILKLAHNAGLQVHAWVNVNLVASAVELPVSPAHIALRHPEWLMVPRALAEELSTVDPTSPAYVGRLARWSRAEPGIEGLYLSVVPTGAAAYTATVIAELVARYPVDGVHLDYLRYPRDDFDYSRQAVAEFRATVAPRLSAADRRRLDAAQAASVLAYPDALPEEWRSFRRSRLTALVMRVRTAVKRYRPRAVVSAAVVPDLTEARDVRLQDWRTWVETGLLDVICPMLYTSDAGTFQRQLQTALDLVGRDRLWAGIGAFRLPPADTIDRILTARRLGASGIVLFSYETLTEAAEHPRDYLHRVAQGAFGDTTSRGLR